MNDKERTHSDDRRRVGGFTIMELLVAMALLMILVAISGVVFRVAVNAYRTAVATSEILRKYRAIVDQLDADFSGLRKDGEIFIAWVPGIDRTDDGVDIVEEFNRFDRILFFSTGSTNFDTYNLWPELPWVGATINDVQKVVIRNTTARICYMLAKDGQDRPAEAQDPRKRVLARSQHVYTSQHICQTNPVNGETANINPTLFPDPANLNTFTAYLNNYYEFDTLLDTDWRDLPWEDLPEQSPKAIMLEQITDIELSSGEQPGRGLQYDENNPRTHHLVLSQGVGQFAVQGWSDQLQRWVPEVDPNGDGNFSDTDFRPNGTGINSRSVIGLLYPGKFLYMNGQPNNPGDLVETNFDNIPGLGRALKFTFTLYDSNKVFPEGKTFTHIVYLPD